MFRKYLLSIMFAASSLGVYAQTAMYAAEYRPGQLLVKFKQDKNVRKNVRGRKLVSSDNSLNQVLTAIGAEEMDQLMPLTGKKVSQKRMRAYNGDEVKDCDLSQLYLVSFDSKKSNVKDAVSKMAQLDDVEYAEPNYLLETQSTKALGDDDPMFSQQWGLFATKVPQMWEASNKSKNYLGHRPVIAILDTGVDITHPDLVANIWTNPHETEDGTDTDDNGFKDDIHGWDFVNQTGRIGDYNGHGTHCAGIAAAVGNNGIGIIGANPDALIMNVTVMQSNGIGDVATIVKGIDYAAANGADVISMSIGGEGHSIAVEQALAKAYSKCALVAAAGNSGKCITDTHVHFPAPAPCYPAAYTFVLGVQASMESGWLAGFSNYDDDGPIFSEYNEEKLYNYELIAPGTGILSTYPGGRYKTLQGTSMACPLVAGIVSRILQYKEILSYEMLFGDLIQTSCYYEAGYPKSLVVDAEKAYAITDKDRKTNFHLVSVSYEDSLGDCDGRVDAGEILDIYPTLRNNWGNTSGSVTVSLDFAENEDTTLCEFLNNDVPLGIGLSGYGKVKTLNPIRVKMRDNIVDGRIVRLIVKVNCDNLSENYEPDEFTFKVENGVELGGTLREDITLYPGIQYIVTRNWGIPKDRVVTVKAGTTIKIKDDVGISNYGYMKFEGTADSMITITKGDNDLGYIGGFLNDNANYCEFNYVKFENLSGITFNGHRYNNCIISNCNVNTQLFFTVGATFRGCEIYNSTCANPYLFKFCFCDLCNGEGHEGWFSAGSTFIETSIHDNIFNHGYGYSERFYHSNYIGNEILFGADSPDFTTMEESNCFGNYYDFKAASNPYYKPDFYSIVFNTTEPEIFYLSNTYIGTASDKVAYKSILDSEDNIGWGTVDVWQKSKYAFEEAPLCVDYVKVDGYDPQDEADLLPPLGVGRHMIEVGFNKAMDQKVHPFITMGVRPPYTQNAFAEDGKWFDPWTYRAYITITGKTATDGTNRIRISDYKQKNQNPAFGAPIEKYRYNVLVSAAGSMSTGMMAEPGLGKVSLTWETDSADFEDLMGYNIYRFTINDSISSDSVMINKEIIESTETEFVDYDVVPGTTYYYYIKEIGTDLVENYVSSTVAATPLTAKKGDANGSMTVDIADVMSEIAYLSNDNPQPFIYEAADVNTDGDVNILDVVGTLRIITNPEVESEACDDEEIAYCHVKDGKLYINSPVAVGGLQVLFNTDSLTSISSGEILDNMERISVAISNNKLMFLAYSMSGVNIPAGEQEIMNVDGTLNVSDIVLSTTRGANIRVVFEDATGISEIVNAPKFAQRGIYDLMGRKLSSLPKHGVVIVNGKKVRL